jgi:hypothetical protein
MTDRHSVLPALRKGGYAALAEAGRETERDRVVASAPEPDRTTRPRPSDGSRDPINRTKFRRLDSNQDHPAPKAGALPITLRRIVASMRDGTLRRVQFHDTGRHPVSVSAGGPSSYRSSSGFGPAALAAQQSRLIPQVIKFLLGAHIRTLARGADILAARVRAPNSRDLEFASPAGQRGARQAIRGAVREQGGGPAGPGRGMRFIIYLVNAKQVIRVLNHVLGAYRQ